MVLRTFARSSTRTRRAHALGGLTGLLILVALQACVGGSGTLPGEAAEASGDATPATPAGDGGTSETDAMPRSGIPDESYGAQGSVGFAGVRISVEPSGAMTYLSGGEPSRLDPSGASDNGFRPATLEGGRCVGFGRAPDGSYVYALYTPQFLQTTDVVLARATADGKPVSSFGTGGRRTYTIGDECTPEAWVAPDGELVLACTTTLKKLDSATHVLRTTPDGTPHPTFGTAGVIRASFQTGQGPLAGPALFRPTNGNVLLRRSTEGNMLVELGPDGAFVGGPSNTRLASLPVDASTHGDFLLAEDGVVFTAFVDDADVALGRWQRGVRDPSFGEAGVVRAGLSGVIGPVRAVRAVDGSVYVAGGTREAGKASASSTAPLLVKLDANGKLDPSFGRGGVAIFPADRTRGHVEELGMDGAGRLYALVHEAEASSPRAVVRVLP